MPSSLYASQMNAADAACLTLRCGPHTARIAPEAGGRILSWSTELPSGRRDWLVPIEATKWPASAWPKGGLFPLAPFSNRVRDAQLHWAGTTLALEPLPGTPHALHGQAQAMPWVVAQVQKDSAVLRLNHPAGAGGWPWDWRLCQTVQLTEAGLQIEMVLENRDATPMPAGLGLHPYFTAHDVHLSATTRWEHEQELALYPEPNTEFQWARRGEATWTHYLSGWDGTARLTWPKGPGLTLHCTEPLTQVVLHCNAGRYLCVEPVTHVCDAFNLAAGDTPGTGIQVLAPGATLAIKMALQMTPSETTKFEAA